LTISIRSPLEGSFDAAAIAGWAALDRLGALDSTTAIVGSWRTALVSPIALLRLSGHGGG
jgi:hypothetical protein